MSSASSPSTARVVILSGPSGAGKTTVVRELLQSSPVPLVLSVSATTRGPRAGELDGREYHFLSHVEFARRRAAGEFLECKEVFGRGDWYGTLRQAVTTGLHQGKWVLLEIDVEGAMAVREQFPDCAMIFLHPGSLAELERRLRGRGTDSEESIRRRLEVAGGELARASEYSYQVVNETPSQAVAEIRAILARIAG
jgi:guanylate kinase